MARSHITLAALATAAVPGFDPVQAQAFSTGMHGDFFSAVVTDAAGKELIVRVPNSAEAEAQLSAEKFALDIMSPGIRSRLNFDVPTYAGKAAIGKTFGLVLEFLPGQQLSYALFEKSPELAQAVGTALAAIHSLPTHFVSDASLPVYSAEDIRRQHRELITRAQATKLVPATLDARWHEAIDDQSLWIFDSTVVHGSLGYESFIIGQDSISAVLGWAALRVGDPASDMNWIINAPIEAQDKTFEAYNQARHSLVDPALRQRATLYSELEIAKWLLHGVETKSTEIVDDAIDMLDQLVDSVQHNRAKSIGTETEPVLTLNEVADLLEETPGDTPHYRGMPPVTDNQRSSSSLSE